MLMFADVAAYFAAKWVTGRDGSHSVAVVIAPRDYSPSPLSCRTTAVVRLVRRTYDYDA